MNSQFQLAIRRLKVALHSRFEAVRVVVELIQVGQRDSLFILLAVHQPNGKASGIIEAQAANRLAVVVVQEDGAIALGIPHHNPLGGNHVTQNRANDMEAFDFLGIRNFWLIKCQRCKEENLSQRII